MNETTAATVEPSGRIDAVVDLAGTPSPFAHPWEICVGSCHAALALREDWRAQLRRCHRELGFQMVRFHGLLDDDVGLLTSWRGAHSTTYNVDSIFDFLLDIGMKPFIELSFMPKLLASGPKTMFCYAGNVTPPADPAAWKQLVKDLMAHCVDRYGLAEVRTWPVEVWNEPNGGAFWAGTQAQYFDLYRLAAEAVKEVDAEIPVGGPATALDAWIPEMLEFCEKNRVPLDFVSTHHYPTDVALGFSDMEERLRRTRRGVLTEKARKVREIVGNRKLYYTEWNSSPSSRDHYHDEPYAAAFAAKTAVDNQGIADIYAWWAFNDIFEELAMPNTPFHGGFGLLNFHGIPKPSYFAFQWLHELGNERIPMTLSGAETTEGVATRQGDDLRCLFYNHQIVGQPIRAEALRVTLRNVNLAARGSVQWVDEQHGCAKTIWQNMGAPANLRRHEVDLLQEAARPALRPLDLTHEGGEVGFEITLSPHAICYVEIRDAFRGLPSPKSRAEAK
jgi:xylan 1,4-beta-xylosidase